MQKYELDFNTTRELVLLNPEDAKQLLENNTNNRNVCATHVKKLTNIIMEQRWGISPSNCIVIDTDGIVIDGQHRLLAIIAAGRSVPIYIERGWPNNTKYYMDFDSRQRTRADVVSTLHKKYAKHLATFLKYAVYFANDKIDKRDNKNYPLNRQENILKILEYFDLKKLMYYFATVNSKGKKGGCSCGVSYFSTLFYFAEEMGVPKSELDTLTDNVFLGIGITDVDTYQYRMRKVILTKINVHKSGTSVASGFPLFYKMFILFLKQSKYIRSEKDFLEKLQYLCPDEMKINKQ